MCVCLETSSVVTPGLRGLCAGMFTEQESDTITFPEITKEVMEEVGSPPCT